MSLKNFITDLKNSNLIAECECGGEFKLSEATLFDGIGKFPVEALEKRTEMEQSLKDWADTIKLKRKRATVGAEKSATAIGVGKNLEKVLPTMKNFHLQLADCRFLADPIDLMVFNGITTNKVHSLSFIEVKSGQAKLNANQKAVKAAVEDKNVSYKEMP